MKVLSREQCYGLAHSLPDTPETVNLISQLRRGLANAWIEGKVNALETAVIEDRNQPGEPHVFGQDPEQIAAVLAQVPGWDCVNAALDIAPQIVPLVEAQTGCLVRLWGFVYHTLTQPSRVFSHPQVRLLTKEDWPLLEGAPYELQGPNPGRALFEMRVAGGFVDGRLVAIAQLVATSAKYGEIGVHTLPPYRDQGLSTAAASLITQTIQSLGLIPVWACGENNQPSLHIAQKLGFIETSRRVYLILDRRN